MATMTDEEKRRKESQGMPVPPAADGMDTSPAKSLMGGGESPAKSVLAEPFRASERRYKETMAKATTWPEKFGATLRATADDAIGAITTPARALGVGAGIVSDPVKGVVGGVTGDIQDKPAQPAAPPATPAPTADQVTADAARMADEDKQKNPMPRTPAADLLGGGMETVAPQDRLQGGYGKPAPEPGSYTPRNLGNDDITEARSQPGLNVTPFPTVKQSQDLQAQQASLRQAKQAAAYRAMGETPPWERPASQRGKMVSGIRENPMDNLKRQMEIARSVLGDERRPMTERIAAKQQIAGLQDEVNAVRSGGTSAAQELLSQQGQTKREAMAQQGQTDRLAMTQQAARNQPVERAQVQGGSETQKLIADMAMKIMEQKPETDPVDARNMAMQMYGMGGSQSSEYRGKTYTIGQEVNLPGGKTGRVVGFNESGAPEFE